MSAHTEALRKCEHCLDTGEIKQDGYLDCVHCDAADKRIALNAYMQSMNNLTGTDRDWAVAQYERRQIETEGVLRDGAKQEPLGYVAVQAGYDTGTVFNTSRVVSKETADACAKQWRPQNRDYRVEVFPVYRHPAPSPTAVVAVPEMMPVKEADQLIELAGAIEQVWLEQTIAEMRAIKYREGPFKAGWESALEEIETRRNLSPQPAAAPSGDAWQPIETAPKGKNGISFMMLACGPEGDQSVSIGVHIDGSFYAGSIFYCLGKKDKPFEIREHKVQPTHWMPIPDGPATKE